MQAEEDITGFRFWLCHWTSDRLPIGKSCPRAKCEQMWHETRLLQFCTRYFFVYLAVSLPQITAKALYDIEYLVNRDRV